MKNIIAVIKKRNVIFVGTNKRLSTSNNLLYQILNHQQELNTINFIMSIVITESDPSTNSTQLANSYDQYHDYL